MMNRGGAKSAGMKQDERYRRLDQVSAHTRACCCSASLCGQAIEDDNDDFIARELERRQMLMQDQDQDLSEVAGRRAQWRGVH